MGVIDLGVIPNRKVIAELAVIKAKGEKGDDLLWESLTPQQKDELYDLIVQEISVLIPSIVDDYLNNSGGLAVVATTGEYSDLKNKPTSLPASDVYAWAKAATKPSYTASEVGLGSVEGDLEIVKNPSFTMAAIRANLVSGESLATLFGKLAKWYDEFSNTAFKSYTTVFSMTNMPMTNSMILVQSSVATAWTLAAMPPLSSHFQIMLYNNGTSAFTQVIPNTGSWDPSNQTTVVVQPSKFVELSLWLMFNRYIVIVREP
jgi:hypothetical protein